MADLAALLADAPRRACLQGAPTCAEQHPDMAPEGWCSACVLRAVAERAGPYLSPVGVEAFEGLRREHLCFNPTSNEECTDSRCCSCNVDAACTCGADRANALLDQRIAAHVAALGEVARLRAELATERAGVARVEALAEKWERDSGISAAVLRAALRGDR